MTFDYLLCDVDAPVAVVTINRPDKLNALNVEVLDELERCHSDLAQRDDVRVIVLTGAGEKAFVAGADISQFSRLSSRDATRFAARGQAVFSQFETGDKPVIAAVNGFALGGGCELALACHLRIASTNARFGQPEVNLGVIPGYGGSQRLPRVVGRGFALEMILTGEPVSAERAALIGLVTKVVPPAELLTEARRLAELIASRGPVALSLAIRAVRASDLPLQEGLAIEAELFGKAFDTEDLSEGASAFLERRKPKFKGR